MKRSLALFAALLIVSLSGLIVTCGVVGGSAENVAVTEDIIYGDASFADGLTVHGVSRYGYHLYWDSEMTFENGVRTDSADFRYYQLNRGAPAVAALTRKFLGLTSPGFPCLSSTISFPTISSNGT